MKRLKLLTLAILPILLSSCEIKIHKGTFRYWNNCDSLKALVDYVEDVTNIYSRNYIPVEDRIATFDMDGTFYGELYPTYLEYWLLRYRGLEDSSYEAPADVKEAAQNIDDYVKKGTALPSGFEMIHARAQAKAFAGMTLKEFDDYVKRFLSKSVEGFSNLTYGESFYMPMLEVFHYLEENNFTYYVVSGSDRYICRSLVCDSLNIAPNRVIGMDVELKSNNQEDVENVNYTFTMDDSVVRTENVMIKNLKMNKVMNINQEIGKQPVLSFGNSGGDSAMHNFALKDNKYKSAAFMLIANDEERDYGNEAKANALAETWRAAKYNVISMKDDFKTIYKEGAKKTSFSWTNLA